MLRGSGRFVTWPALLIVFLWGLQGLSRDRQEGRVITRVNGAEAVESEVLFKYRDGHNGASHHAIEVAADADKVQSIDGRGLHRLR